uniref:ADAMTS like 3 n=1 Tax=Pavo cristatus TaxID=9049 RepID=A0A8C9L739_PAVCR
MFQTVVMHLPFVSFLSGNTSQAFSPISSKNKSLAAYFYKLFPLVCFQDCPSDVGDFRAQQCSAYNDVKYQGHIYEWIPVYNDPTAPCALKCQALGKNLIVELAPKVLDGTRCNTESLDMCISGICQAVGCDRQLGSNAKEDNCGICAGDGSTCRLVRGQAKAHVSPEKREETVIAVPHGSRSVRITLKGPAHLVIESKTLQGDKGEHSFDEPGTFVIENTTVEFQKTTDREIIKIQGPLGADFIIKTRYSGSKDSVVQFFFYQPISHQWRQTEFFPCTVTCGGGYQLNSAECVDIRLKRVVPDHYCHYYPENKKPKPKLKECNMDPCPSSDGFKEIMPYDHFQPLPRYVQSEKHECSEYIHKFKWSLCATTLRYTMLTSTYHLAFWRNCLVLFIFSLPEKSPVEAKSPWFKQAHEMEETRAVSEEPTFIPEPWSPCSATCGSGIQVRDVKCRILLSFTQTEVELPEEECEDVKPPTEQVCHEAPCDSDPVPYTPEFSRAEDGSVIYDWEYIGFTPCSATCLGGTQEAIAMCLHVETKQAVNETLCDNSKRPPPMTHACNMKLCPPRWQTGPWRRCSATCGVGIQTRDVYCQQPGGSTVAAEDCKDKKPHSLQACNQIDCPPVWHVEEWQQCSRTCGGGIQTRKVYCKQLLTDGSFLKHSDDTCREPKLPTTKSCAKVDCPPQLVVGEWSKCSVSCGVGIQRRKIACQNRTAKGQYVAVNESMCSGSSPSLLVRSCQMDACNKIKPKLPEKYSTRGPRIISIHRVYIQTRQEKRINFTIGSRAYLLPKTSVVIKCPVRRFQKSLIRWEKDEQHLQNSKRLGITKSGSLKIHSLEATDIGVYRCIAGSAHETFVLKLIGNDNRLIEPPNLRKHASEITDADHNEANSFGAKWHKMSKMWQMWSKKNELYLGERQVNDQPFLRNLEAFGSNSAGVFSSHEFKNKRLEAAVLQGAYSMDTVQFEELIRNMSQLIETGEVSDDLASQVIYQLIAELSRPPQSTTEKWKGAQDEKLASKFTGKSPNESDRFSTKTVDKLMSDQKVPVIMRQKEIPGVSFNKTVTVRIGNTVFLTKNTQSVNLLCETAGISEVKYTWTKDGETLKSSENVILDTIGKVQIHSPTEKELGTYGCLVVNDFGFDMETSLLLRAEAPVILFSVLNVTNLEASNLSAVVGGTIIAKIGANITVECPVKGVPQPNVTWFTKKGILQINSFLLSNGSLFLRNVSYEDAGTYSCRATNALGRAEAVSTNKSNVILHCAQCFHIGKQGRLQETTGKRSEMKEKSAVRRNCSSEVCDVYWRTGPWRPCSVQCGSGFQSRRVHCVHRKNNRLVADQYCGWKKRPVSWQHCNATACDECKDTTHYCTFAKQLRLCLIDVYKQRCCQSCQEM